MKNGIAGTNIKPLELNQTAENTDSDWQVMRL